MLYSQGMPLFTNTLTTVLNEQMIPLQERNLFGLIGNRWWPHHLATRKQLKSSDRQLVYSIDSRSMMLALWP